MTAAKLNLFIYGSLRDRRIFQSVCGLSFTRKASKIRDRVLFAEPAMLPGYRRVSPDNVYFYAVAANAARIDGYVIHDVPAWAMAEIDRYEGKRYERETVRVNSANGYVAAQAYLVSHESMEKHFGDRFHVNLIHELWLRKRIEKFIKRRTRPGERTADAESERRAERELLGTTERDLVMSHYHSDAVSDYYLQHELDRPRPSIESLKKDPQATPLIRNYLGLVVRQVLLNQLEERLQFEYRFEIEHMRTSERYYNRSISLLIALRIINANRDTVDMITNECLKTMPHQTHDLIDYVKYAVGAARSMFDARVARAQIDQLGANLHPGLVPLGIELELSNLGPAAVEPQRSLRNACDPVYDGFKYFSDFCLDVLCWKVGGYIDDHSGSVDQDRRSGFLELAPGRLNIRGELSRPATADPWLLNQLIQQLTEFYDIRPHSLHISFQLRKRQIGKQKMLPLGFVKCLLVLGGGLEQRDTGRLWVSRMQHDEITQYGYGEELVFARTSKRSWYLGGDDIANKPPVQATTCVQQYKFIRLARKTTYEPLIMALKGLQIAYNPADYLSADQLRGRKKLQQQYEILKKWAAAPNEISHHTIDRFITTVHAGLSNERHRRPAHGRHYIDWAITSVETQLRNFNKKLREPLAAR